MGVQVGSTMAMLLNQRHVGVSMFGFEDEMMEALAAREIDAAAVTATVAGYLACAAERNRKGNCPGLSAGSSHP